MCGEFLDCPVCLKSFFLPQFNGFLPHITRHAGFSKYQSRTALLPYTQVFALNERLQQPVAGQLAVKIFCSDTVCETSGIRLC